MEQIFQKAKEKTKRDKDLEIVTDKLPSYPHAIGKVFYKGQDWGHNMTIRHHGLAGINKSHQKITT